MFRKVVTEQYPFEKMPTNRASTGGTSSTAGPDGLEKCVGCELCAWSLPGGRDLRRGCVERRPARRVGALQPGERYGRVYQINHLRCILCGLCIEACPTPR